MSSSILENVRKLFFLQNLDLFRNIIRLIYTNKPKLNYKCYVHFGDWYPDTEKIFMINVVLSVERLIRTKYNIPDLFCIKMCSDTGWVF